MHDPSAARRKSYGLGPVSVPPAEAGSSPVYHGVLAPCARGRAPVVRYGRPASDATALPADAPPRHVSPRGAWTWAAFTPDTPLFWSSWGRRSVGRVRQPMAGKNIWRLCKTYGKLIGCPELKPHDLRHGVAVEVLERRHDLEEVRALLGHVRIATTQIYTRIRPPQLRRAVAFYDHAARRMLTG